MLEARSSLPEDVQHPLLVKIAPDLTEDDKEDIAAVVTREKVCLVLFYFCYCFCKVGRSDGLMTSVLDSGSRGLGSSPDRVIVLCSWARHSTLTMPLSIQEYKWVPVNCQGNLTKC